MRNDEKNQAEPKEPQAKVVKLQKNKASEPLDHLLKDLEKINDEIEAHWEQEEQQDNNTQNNTSFSNSKDSM